MSHIDENTVVIAEQPLLNNIIDEFACAETEYLIDKFNHNLQNYVPDEEISRIKKQRIGTRATRRFQQLSVFQIAIPLMGKFENKTLLQQEINATIIQIPDEFHNLFHAWHYKASSTSQKISADGFLDYYAEIQGYRIVEVSLYRRHS